jgi:hypothetical protein
MKTNTTWRTTTQATQVTKEVKWDLIKAKWENTSAEKKAYVSEILHKRAQGKLEVIFG